jgi:hypothetical protein
MKFVITKKKTSLPDLVPEVFEIKGGKAAAAKTAQAALEKANRSIANLKKLPAGTLVVVPALAGTTTTASTQSVGIVDAKMIEDLKKVLAAAKAVAEESSAAQIADAERNASLATSSELVELAEKTPELKKRLSGIIEKAKTQAKQAGSDKTAQIQALSLLEKNLASLSLQ